MKNPAEKNNHVVPNILLGISSNNKHVSNYRSMKKRNGILLHSCVEPRECRKEIGVNWEVPRALLSTT